MCFKCESVALSDVIKHITAPVPRVRGFFGCLWAGRSLRSPQSAGRGPEHALNVRIAW